MTAPRVGAFTAPSEFTNPSTPTPTPTNSASAFLESLLTQWGLSELLPAMRDMLTAGDPAEVIPLKLRETEPYKRRFAGNIQRVANGLQALTEAEYLATETALKTVIRRYVGAGVYDTKDNLDKWMANDLSAQELNDRLGVYQRRYLEQPDTVKDAWSAQGLTPADAIRTMMDPTVDEPTLRRQADIYGLGAEAFKAYKDPSALNRTRLAELVDKGVDVDDAARGFQDVAAREEAEARYARMQGTELTRADQEDAAVAGDATAERKRRKVLAGESAKYEENYLGGGNSLARGRSTY